MKIISFRDKKGESFGIVDGNGRIVDVGRKSPYSSIRDALKADALEELAKIAADEVPTTGMGDIELLPVIPKLHLLEWKRRLDPGGSQF